MILGVPTLCCYAKLDKLIESAERGSVKPTRYVIIDNGGYYAMPRIACEIDLVRPGRNIGVAASWNHILELAEDEDVLITNDDIVFSEGTFAAFKDAIRRAPLATSPHGWDVFAQSEECTRKVGLYDEEFFPAYYEDNDYARRAALAGITPSVVLTPYEHDRSSTLREYPEAWKIRAGADRNRLYYERKWGGAPGAETFTTPFDGKPPTPSPASSSGRAHEPGARPLEDSSCIPGRSSQA